MTLSGGGVGERAGAVNQAKDSSLTLAGGVSRASPSPALGPDARAGESVGRRPEAAEGATAPASLRHKGPHEPETLWKASTIALTAGGPPKWQPAVAKARAGKALRTSDR